jgi:methionyl-tRNA synthetase
MSTTQRPIFPSRAVVTGGMPYGNKELHFGHIGGVFIHADIWARFLRDRIGEENVLFVSGTDCFGSPIVVYHQNLLETGSFDGTLQEFVQKNHNAQKSTLDSYLVSPNLFAASSLGRAAEIHKEMSVHFFDRLREHGHIVKRETLQFYDSQEKVFLNGRQVVGRCPIQGCSSEKAYADECSLGHQYRAEDLHHPKSILSGTKPELRPVVNWYLSLPSFHPQLQKWATALKKNPSTRKFFMTTLEEFLEEPVVHVPKKFEEELTELRSHMADHKIEDGAKKSFVLRFSTLSDRDEACALLANKGMYFRTGKTLVPFRLSGNIEWGIPVPETDGVADLTFWVWPESLWAPISFCAAYLESIGKDKDSWKEWWCSEDAEVYQFIGEDNIYFYGLAEMGLFLGMQGENPIYPPPNGSFSLPNIIVNRHLLFLKSKASSSGNVKPPMADELLSLYTPEQLRAHFISLGLGYKNISFKPKSLNPKANERDPDPVLKEGKLLTNVFNRVARSCFYTIQRHRNGKIPVGVVSEQIREETNRSILSYEKAMHTHQFHQAFNIADSFIRYLSKFWAKSSTNYNSQEHPVAFDQFLVDAFHMLRISTVLMHPIVPLGTEKILTQLNLSGKFWSWDHIFEDIYFFMEDPETHLPKELPPRTDFFQALYYSK